MNKEQENNLEKLEPKVSECSSHDTFIILAKSECHQFLPENEYSIELKKLSLPNLMAYFVSPNQFNFINLDTLTSFISTPNLWSGMILTSTRCVDALVQCWNNLPNYDYLHNQWSQSVILTVGESTRVYLQNKLNLNSIGHHTGNAQSLSEFILENSNINHEKPLLYPCSKIRSDTLSTTLAGKITVQEIACYETVLDEKVDEDLNELKKIIEDKIRLKNCKLNIVWVFFSPSGVMNLFKRIQNLFSEHQNNLSHKFVAFGKQTEQKLLSLDVDVWFVCSSPNSKTLASEFYNNFMN